MSMNANTKTTITLDSGDKAQFLLEPGEYSTKVYFLGMYLGEISSYEGSLDRRSGMIRIPGKTRTLWSAKSNTDTRTSFQFKTRGDALRYLSRTAVI